jgi:hypothetical protein
MADETKKYLINIESNLKEYIDELVQAKKKLEDAKLAVDNLKSGQFKSREEIEKTNAAYRQAKKEVSDATKMVDLATKANNSETGSRKQLSEILNLQMQELGKLGNAYIINAKGQKELNPLYIEQRKQIAATKQAIIDYDLALNDGRSNIGRYGESVSIAMKEAGKNIVSLFPSLRPVISGINSIQRAMKEAGTTATSSFKAIKADIATTGTTATSSFKAIKAAIATTGIGLLVIAATALVALLGKLGIGKILMDKFTDAIGLTTVAQDKLAESQRKSNEANIAGLNNELTLLKAKGVSMDEIFQKQLAIAKANFEIERATILAYSLSKKNFDLAAKGGEQDLKLQEAKTAYFALLESQNKSAFDQGSKNINDLTLLRKEGLDKDLLVIEQWYAAESTKHLNDYSLYLLYEEKKKQAQLKYTKEREDSIKKQNIDAEKEAQSFIDETLSRMDKEAEAKWNSEVEFQRKLFEQRRKAGQEEYDARIKQEEALADAVIKIQESMSDSKIRIAAAATNFLSSIAGENKVLQNASLIADKAFAIAQVVIATTKANATIRAMAAASVLPGPGYLARLGISMAAAQAPINLNRIAAVADIAAIIAATVAGLSSNSKSSGGGSSAPAPTSISSAPATQRITANQVGPTILTQQQLSQNQLNAMPNQNLLTAEDIARALSNMPAPIVTVEDINAKTKSVNKVSVRANI